MSERNFDYILENGNIYDGSGKNVINLILELLEIQL